MVNVTADSSKSLPRFGIEGCEDIAARSSAAESSPLDPSLLNNNPFKTSSIVEPVVPTLAPCSVESVHPHSIAGNVCDCIVCAGVGKKVTASKAWPFHCRVPGCNALGHNISFSWELLRKEASHFRTPGEDKLKCAESNCPVAVSSMTDLRRHYISKHCTKSEKFSCPLVWCKYSGDNGFKRKDKLNSHYRNAHEGKMGRGKATRVTKPKSSTSGSGSGGMGDGASGKKRTPPVSRT